MNKNKRFSTGLALALMMTVLVMLSTGISADKASQHPTRIYPGKTTFAEKMAGQSGLTAEEIARAAYTRLAQGASVTPEEQRLIDQYLPGLAAALPPSEEQDEPLAATKALLIELETELNYYEAVEDFAAADRIKNEMDNLLQIIYPPQARTPRNPLDATGDDCSDPIIWTVGTAPASLLNQTTCGRGNTYSTTCLGNYDGGEEIIIRLVVTANLGNATLTLNPKGTTWTGVAIDDSCPPDASCIASVATSSGTSKTTPQFPLPVGTYYIIVDTWPTPNCIPDFDLTITAAAPPPANDACSGAIALAIPSTTNGSTQSATTESPAPPFCVTSWDAGSKGVWYTVAGTNNTITASLCGSAYDTKLFVYTGTCAALTCVTGNDDFCGLQSQVSWCSNLGTTYYVLVTGYLTNSGNFTLNLTDDGVNCQLPNLVIQNLSPCGTQGPNPAAIVSYRVRNLGAGAAAATTAYFSFDGGATIDTEPVPPIPPTSFFDVFFDVTVNLSGPTHTLSAQVDPVPGESNVTDNAANCAITVARPCNVCTPADAVLGPPTLVPWGDFVSGNCGNGGKWVGEFTATSGNIYHFDLCPDAPGTGTNAGFGSGDIDIKICGATCNILAGVDGLSSCTVPWSPNDFQWTAPSSGTFYVILAPYSSYNSHTCNGTATQTFTMNYYQEPPPPPPPGINCSLPIIIAALPYSHSSSTVGMVNDHNPDCVFFSETHTAPDVAYHYTPASDEWVTFSLCTGTTYDSKLGVYDATNVVPGAELYCNDDFCGLQSEIPCARLFAGITYCIIVDGFGSGSGGYTLTATACAAPADVWVDDDWTSQDDVDLYDPSLIWQYDAYNVIQDGIDAVSGSTVNVLAGTYVEQLYIDSPLSLIGAGMGSTILQAVPTGSRTTYSITQWNGATRTVDACIGVKNAGTVDITGFTVDGLDLGPDNFYGIHFFNTGGSVTECRIDNVTHPAAPGAQRVVSLVATHGVGQTIDLDFSDNEIPDFQKGGILIMGPGATFTVDNNTVSDVPSPAIAGNGIQLSYGASGSTSGNVVDGTAYTGPDWAGTGILLFECGDISMNGDEVLNCQNGVNFSDWGWVYNHPAAVTLTFTNLKLHDNEWTFGAQLSRNNSDPDITLTDCEIEDASGDGIDIYGTGPDPWGGSYYSGWNNGDLYVNISGCKINGSALDGIWTADLSGNGNTVHAFDVFNTSFFDNAGSAINNTWSFTMNASGCYWGDAAGPTVGSLLRSGSRLSAPIPAPFGDDLPLEAARVSVPASSRALDTGETILGPVDYTPWMVNDGTYTDPGFDGDFSELTVDDDSPQTGTVGYVQEAVDMVTSSTVNIAPGTYAAPVLITGTWPSGLFLLGPNAGVSACTGARGPEAIFTSAAPGGTFNVQASNVTVDGMQIVGPVYGVVANATLSNLTVKNCIVDGATDTGVNFWRAATGTIQHNRIINCLYGISAGDDAGTPGTGDDVQTNALIEYNCLDNCRLAVTGYHNGSVIRYNTIANFAAAPPAAGVSGQQQNTVIRQNTITGYAQGAGVSFTPYPNRPNSAGVWIDQNILTGNAAGVYMIDPVTGLQVTANTFSNSVVNAQDVNTSIYDLNCWSDHLPGHPGYPAQYNVPGGANVDYNPNPNSCGNVDFIVSSLYVGCPAGCPRDTLYLTWDQAGFITGQIFVQLPAALDADWPAGNQYQNIFPGGNVSPNLVFAAGRRVAGNRVEVNVQWQPPYSDGDGSKYIACIPLINSSTTHGDPLLITGAGSTFWNPGGPHVNVYILGSVILTVDCDAPTVTLGGGAGETGCNAYNTAAEFLNAVTVFVGVDALPNTPLNNAYILLNGTTQYDLFTSPIVGDYNATWPTGAETPDVWATMTEGCNTLELHGFDTECNHGVSTLLTVVKDTQAPGLTVSNTSVFCYNNWSLSPQYGGSQLDDYLDITTVLDPTALGVCAATSGTLEISYGGGMWFNLGALDFTAYPSTDAEALTLWTWMLTVVPGTANGETYTFDLRACDCAGNCITGSFTICIDLTAPGNTFAEFDARPTDMGVWLKWTWGYHATQAVLMEVWRSPDSGLYPGYGSNLWANLGSNANYPQTYPPAGWTLIAQQNGAVATTSTLYPGTHGGPGGTYWEDADPSWIDESEDRDIYRYVTFVKDAAGNWSNVGGGGYALNLNADRSTNYWLGDFSRDELVDPEGSSGYVNTTDLGFLSGVYFTAVPPTSGWYDVGPENSENGFGKGIPTPDGLVNFSDLVPFAFNYGLTGPNTFSVNRSGNRSFRQLDALPVVDVSLLGSGIRAGEEFTVAVNLSGAGDAVKVVEVNLTYDPHVLELVSAVTGDIGVLDGVLFTKARGIGDKPGVVGVAAAACGELATLTGDVTLATVTFRWAADRVAGTELRLSRVDLADGAGTIVSAEGNVLSLGAYGVIPTAYALHQNYPNPFNPVTTIAFDLPEDVDVRLVIYNLLGQEVKTLVAEAMVAGAYRVQWDGTNNGGQPVGSGLYVFTFRAGSFHRVMKMMLTR